MIGAESAGRVPSSGQYLAIGSLYACEHAIALSQKATSLDVRDGTIPMLFFGKILHDRGLDGPYVLRFVMLFEHPTTGDIPGETIDPAYASGVQREELPRHAIRSASAHLRGRRHEHPSQQGKPPALISAAANHKLINTSPPINPDPTDSPPRPVPTGTK